CRRLASPGPETARPLQHPVAETAETGIVSTGFDHALRPSGAAEDQAAGRAALSSCRGQTGARAARSGRRDRQDRAGVQRTIAAARRGTRRATRFHAVSAAGWEASFRLVRAEVARLQLPIIELSQSEPASDSLTSSRESPPARRRAPPDRIG